MRLSHSDIIDYFEIGRATVNHPTISQGKKMAETNKEMVHRPRKVFNDQGVQSILGSNVKKLYK